jgi:hypothetical protein
MVITFSFITTGDKMKDLCKAKIVRTLNES